MLPMENRNVVALAGTAAALVAGAYVLWGPGEKRRSKRKGTCPGLVNLGNTCFLNSLLQALAPCPSILQWLRELLDRHQHLDYTKFLSHTVLNVLKVLNNDSVEFTEEYCPHDVISALQARRWIISSDQQDAHELLHVLTETLDEEASRYPSVLSLFNVHNLVTDPTLRYQSRECARIRIDTQLPVLPQRSTGSPLKGLLASQLQCKKCLHKCAVKYDAFDSLSLSIPSDYIGTITLDQLLHHFIMSESVQNVGCEGCAALSDQSEEETDGGDTKLPRTTFVKKLTIGKLPTCLCLHIQRTVWLNSGEPMKRFEHVDFPEILNLNDFVYHKKQKPVVTMATGLSLDIGARLVGGRKGMNGYNKVNAKKLMSSGPTSVTVPYSGPVNLLKALNYHSRGNPMSSGLFPPPPPPPNPTTVPHGDQHPQNNVNVQRLAQTYSTEVLSPTHNNTYKLTAVIVHLGDTSSGHFITYRRAVSVNGQHFPGQWLYTSDTYVKRVDYDEVQSANAYMLFYEKI